MQRKPSREWQEAGGGQEMRSSRSCTDGEVQPGFCPAFRHGEDFIFCLPVAPPGGFLLWPQSLGGSGIVWRGKGLEECPRGTPTVPEPPSSVMKATKEMSHIINSS